MAAPAVGVTTDRMYRRLPELYRDADALEDFDLLRFLSLVVDQASEMEAIYERLAVGEHLDAQAADAAWLPWLAQLLGVRLVAGLTEVETRDAVSSGSSGWRAGTKAAVAAAAQSVLTGTRYAKVYDHSTSTGAGLGTASEWDVLVVTRSSETPDPAVVLDAIVRKRAKPAGVVLHHQDYESDWAALEALGSWNAIEALGSWDAMQEQGI